MAAIPDWIVASPLAFAIGFLFGLAMASRYRIVKVRDPENGDRNRNRDRDNGVA